MIRFIKNALKLLVIGFFVPSVGDAIVKNAVRILFTSIFIVVLIAELCL